MGLSALPHSMRASTRSRQTRRSSATACSRGFSSPAARKRVYRLPWSSNLRRPLCLRPMHQIKSLRRLAPRPCRSGLPRSLHPRRQPLLLCWLQRRARLRRHAHLLLVPRPWQPLCRLQRPTPSPLRRVRLSAIPVRRSLHPSPPNRLPSSRCDPCLSLLCTQKT